MLDWTCAFAVKAINGDNIRALVYFFYQIYFSQPLQHRHGIKVDLPTMRQILRLYGEEGDSLVGHLIDRLVDAGAFQIVSHHGVLEGPNDGSNSTGNLNSIPIQLPNPNYETAMRTSLERLSIRATGYAEAKEQAGISAEAGHVDVARLGEMLDELRVLTDRLHAPQDTASTTDKNTATKTKRTPLVRSPLVRAQSTISIQRPSTAPPQIGGGGGGDVGDDGNMPDLF